MKALLISGLLAIAAVASSGAAEAKGCLKGAAVGGTAGHFAGGHGVLGAVAGCAIGRHRANKQDRTRADQAPAPAR